MPGIIERLRTEDWNAMTAAASASARHVSRLERWIALAREANPALTDEQAGRLAVLMRTEHFRKMARKSAAVRAARARARAEAQPE